MINNYRSGAAVVLYHGDRLELLNQIAASGDRAQLVVTSPPYNVGKQYESRLSLEDYLEDQRRTIEAAAAILSPIGSICWQVGHMIQGKGREKEAIPLDLALYPIFKSLGLILKSRIVWTFGHGLHETTRLSGRHETILWFVRSPEYTFNLDPIRVPQKYPGKRHFKGPRAGELSGNRGGKNPSDVWDMPNVKNNHVEKTDHPCQFPLALVKRLILSLTNQGDLVVDPYIGSGTTAAAAILAGRRVAGADTSLDYLERIAEPRIEAAAAGTLRYRAMNKAIHKPKGKLTTVPAEWGAQ